MSSWIDKRHPPRELFRANSPLNVATKRRSRCDRICPSIAEDSSSRCASREHKHSFTDRDEGNVAPGNHGMLARTLGHRDGNTRNVRERAMTASSSLAKCIYSLSTCGHQRADKLITERKEGERHVARFPKI